MTNVSPCEVIGNALFPARKPDISATHDQHIGGVADPGLQKSVQTQWVVMLSARTMTITVEIIGQVVLAGVTGRLSDRLQPDQ